MKTLRLVAMIVALTALPVEGQLEFSGGMNLSGLSGSDAGNATGMIFGVGAILPLGGFGLNLGGNWAQKGVEEILTDTATQQEIIQVLDLRYIEVPLHFRVPVLSGGGASLNLVLGPTFGFQIGCEVSDGLSAAQDCESLLDGPDLKKTEIGGAAGLGVSFGLGGIVYAGFDARYTFGMTSISELSTDALKNRTLSLQTHVGFSIF